MLKCSLLALCVVTLLAGTARAEVAWKTLSLPDGGSLEYALVTPSDFDAQSTYPVLLALPPGDQSRTMVEAGLSRYWRKYAADMGWVVVSPAAPEGRTFVRDSHMMITALLDAISAQLVVEGEKYYLVGVSNGGRSAFRAALDMPARFASLTVAPGYPPDNNDYRHFSRLAGMPVSMIVGGDDDEAWIQQMQRADQLMKNQGVTVSLNVIAGEGHVPASLDNGGLMGHLRAMRESARQMGNADQVLIGQFLDRFHRAASEANATTYFRHFSPNAVFIGTDATERWTLAEFKAFAMPLFSAGTGWTYRPMGRSITVSRDGRTAWFDELLKSDKYGECRGTGTLIRVQKQWKIAQYHLSIPVPNAIAIDVVALIQEQSER